jgi:hypothetical protein
MMTIESQKNNSCSKVILQYHKNPEYTKKNFKQEFQDFFFTNNNKESQSRLSIGRKESPPQAAAAAAVVRNNIQMFSSDEKAILSPQPKMYERL